MRYNIYEAAEKTISLTKDIENIKDFIQIQKIRYHQLTVSFIEDIDNPFSENFTSDIDTVCRKCL